MDLGIFIYGRDSSSVLPAHVPFLRSRGNLSVHRHASNVLQFSFGAACLPELKDLVIASRLHADLAWKSVNINASTCHVSMPGNAHPYFMGKGGARSVEVHDEWRRWIARAFADHRFYPRSHLTKVLVTTMTLPL